MARKTNRELIADCYANGGRPVVTQWGQYISCEIKTASSKNAPQLINAIGDINQGVSNDSDGFYGATGGVDNYYNAGGDQFAAFLDKLVPSRGQKASSMQSEAELNSAIAEALRKSGNQTPVQPTSGNKNLMIVGGVLIVAVIGFVVYKTVKG